MVASRKSSASLATETPLSVDDLIRDEPLDRIAGSRAIPDELDLLNHRTTARRVAQLAATARDQLNIAVFGPWGAGKSSFFGLLEQELERLSKPIISLRFDAWQNAGSGFRENFLADLSKQLGMPGMDGRLFATKRSVQLPFVSKLGNTGRRNVLIGLVALALLILVGLPLLHTSLSGSESDFWARFWPNWIGWVSFGASSSLIFVVITAIANFAKIDVEEARPSYVNQFRTLFRELLDTRPNARFAILIDELDRCAPEDVMVTLEGLRTFLGHERCVFVVAFDRAAVADAIRERSRQHIPTRPGSAYYSTAGEYLDKIFQFQISLPPQSNHGPRRYALSLVEGKGGVWSSLRAESPQLLSRVVQLLSPIHLRSPRRTKVMLNDYAINMRLYESMGFDWIQRAEEIAVWTVLQMEFPGFAAEIQTDTRVLARSVNELPSPEIEGSARPSVTLDEVETDVVVRSPDDSPQDIADENNRISEELRNDLRSYLRRVVELGVTLPRADLILMHSGGRLLTFEDLTIYNLLQDVAGVSRREMAEAIGRASPADRAQALTHLLEQMEADPPDDERGDLLVAVGEAASSLSTVEVEAYKFLLRRQWWGLGPERQSVASSSSSAAGFLRSFVGEPNSEFRKALFALPTDDPRLVAEVVSRISRDASDAQLLENADQLLSIAAPGAIFVPEIVRELLLRVDSIGNPELEGLVEAIRRTFSIPEPVASPALRSARAEAADLKESAEAQYETASREAKVAFGHVLFTSFREDGTVRRALNIALLGIEGREDWPLSLHDEALISADLAVSTAQRNADLLRAISIVPERAAHRWIGLLDQDVDVELTLAEHAAVAVIEQAVSSEDDVLLEEAVKCVARILSLKGVREGVTISELVESASSLATMVDWSQTRIAAAMGLLRALEVVNQDLDPLLDLQVRVYLAAFAAVDSSTATALADSVGDLHVIVRRAVASQLDPSGADIATSIVVRAQVGAGFASSELVRPSTVVSRYPSDPPIVGLWMKAGPIADDVQTLRAGLGTGVVTTSDLAAWAGVASIEQRTILWRQLVSEGALVNALAAAGEDVSEAVVAEEVQALANATAAPAREAALTPFHYLPAASRAFRRAVVSVAPALADAGTQQDLSTLAALLERRPSVSSSERIRLRGFVDEMAKKHPTVLSRQRVASLVESGFLSRRGLGGLLDRVTGSK